MNCAQNLGFHPLHLCLLETVCSGWSARCKVIRLLDRTTKQDAAILYISRLKSECMSTLPKDSHIFLSSTSCN
jgi:hypothetical protein